MSPERETKHQGGATSKKFNSIRSTNSFNSNSYKFLAGIIYNVANLILEMHLNLSKNLSYSKHSFARYFCSYTIISSPYWQLDPQQEETQYEAICVCIEKCHISSKGENKTQIEIYSKRRG